MSVYLNERFQYVSDEGVRYASVSQILRDVGIRKSFDGKVSPAVLEHAAWRGKEVEKHCFHIAKFGFTDCPDDEEISTRVSAFNDWWNTHDLEYVSHHEVVWDDEILVAHELDLVVKLEGQLTAVDIKSTASAEKDWPIQCGAQMSMRGAMTFESHDGAVLHINPKFKKGYIYRPYGQDAASAWELASDARIVSLGAFRNAKALIEELSRR